MSTTMLLLVELPKMSQTQTVPTPSSASTICALILTLCKHSSTRVSVLSKLSLVIAYAPPLATRVNCVSGAHSAYVSPIQT